MTFAEPRGYRRFLCGIRPIAPFNKGYTNLVPDQELRNDDDVEAILRIAINQSSVDGGQSLRERLNRSAQELGLSPEQIQAAERAYFDKQRETQDLAEYTSIQRRSFMSSLGTYVLVNGSFAVFNLITDKNLGWAVWPIAVWGFFLVSSFPGEMMPRSQSFQEGFAKWKRKRAKKGGELPDDEPLSLDE